MPLLPLLLALAAECPRATLPAYAHNDYANARPLADALAAGYRGVEADVFLVDGELRVGHDRRRAARGGTLDALYLAPLAELAARCGAPTGEARPFLLFLEIKEESPETYDALVRLLGRYGRVIDAEGGRRAAPVEVVMVGWLPAGAAGAVRRQQRIGSRADTSVSDPRVRLLSLDYGKTMGRFWTTTRGRRRWLETLRAARRRAGGRLLRVHDVPADSAVYAELLGAGVDLIGTKELARTRAVLAPALASAARTRR